MAKTLGFKKEIVVGKEAAWGTKEVTTYKTLITDSEELAKNPAEILSEGIHSDAGRDHADKGRFDTSGPIGPFPVYPTGVIGMLLKQAMGGYNFAVDTPVAGTNTHTFTLSDALPFGLTFSVDRIAAVLDFFGCLINEFTLGSSDGYLMGNLTMIGKDQDVGSSPTPVLPTTRIFTHFDSVIQIDAGPVSVQEWTSTLSNNLIGVPGNTRTPNQISRNGLRDVTGTVTLSEVQNLTYYDKFIAGTDATLNVAYTGAIITGATPYSLTIDFPRIRLNGPPAIGGGDVSLPNQPIDFRALRKPTATEEEFSVVLVSDDTTFA